MAADGGVELPGPADGAGALCDRPTRWAPLRVVQETLAGEEGLFPTREHELTRAVAAGEGPILEHPFPILLVSRIAWFRLAAPRADPEGPPMPTDGLASMVDRARTRNS
jgi:hypothetical protein